VVGDLSLKTEPARVRCLYLVEGRGDGEWPTTPAEAQQQVMDAVETV